MRTPLLRSLTSLALLTFLLLAGLPVPLDATASTGAVVGRMPAAAYYAASPDAIRAIDYGSFVWLELTGAQAARLAAADLPFDPVEDPYTLHLGGIRFDPLHETPDLPPGWDTLSTGGPDLYLVQFHGPTRAVWLDGLRRAGIEVVQYIHPFTYVVWGSPDGLAVAAAADPVRWSGPFATAYRVLPQWRALPAAPVRVNVLFYRGAPVDAAIGQIERLGGSLVGRAALNDRFETAGFVIAGDRLRAAARAPGVYSIQPEPTDGGLRGEMSNQVNVNNVDGTNLAFPGYRAWLTAAGVDGSGVIMANVDGGVNHTHPDLVTRFISCAGTTCGGSASSNHGTHTAGIMAADGASGVLDSYGFLRGLGMAPGANLVEQVYSPYYTWTDGMLLLIRDSYANGAVLSSNSWGPAGTPQGYDNHTMQVDIGVRDAAPTTPGNQSFTYVLSIMNGDGGVSSQGSPDEAKNILTIGSTRMQSSSGAQYLDINNLSSAKSYKVVPGKVS